MACCCNLCTPRWPVQAKCSAVAATAVFWIYHVNSSRQPCLKLMVFTHQPAPAGYVKEHHIETGISADHTSLGILFLSSTCTQQIPPADDYLHGAHPPLDWLLLYTAYQTDRYYQNKICRILDVIFLLTS